MLAINLKNILNPPKFSCLFLSSKLNSVCSKLIDNYYWAKLDYSGVRGWSSVLQNEVGRIWIFRWFFSHFSPVTRSRVLRSLWNHHKSILREILGRHRSGGGVADDLRTKIAEKSRISGLRSPRAPKGKIDQNRRSTEKIKIFKNEATTRKSP